MSCISDYFLYTIHVVWWNVFLGYLRLMLATKYVMVIKVENIWLFTSVLIWLIVLSKNKMVPLICYMKWKQANHSNTILGQRSWIRNNARANVMREHMNGACFPFIKMVWTVFLLIFPYQYVIVNLSSNGLQVKLSSSK